MKKIRLVVQEKVNETSLVEIVDRAVRAGHLPRRNLRGIQVKEYLDDMGVPISEGHKKHALAWIHNNYETTTRPRRNGYTWYNLLSYAPN